MIDSNVAMIVIYFGSIMLLMLEHVFELLIEYWMDDRKSRNDRIIRDEWDGWEWLEEVSEQPIEVTCDHETFLVYDRKTGRWDLEKRGPSDDFIDSLFGDCSERETILIETMPFYNGYSTKQPKRGFGGIKSPSWERYK